MFFSVKTGRTLAKMDKIKIFRTLEINQSLVIQGVIFLPEKND
jgi:hypothetical protein